MLQEFILFSDILGISALVDTLNNPKPEGVTESTGDCLNLHASSFVLSLCVVLGPFLTADAHHIEEGGSIASEGSGEYFLVQGQVTDRNGKGIAGAEIVRRRSDPDSSC